MHHLWYSTEQEKKDLLLSWALVSLAFAIASSSRVSSRFPLMMLIASITVGLGFVLHELSHRIVARYLGFEAHYKAYKQGLYLGVFLSFFGIIFLAPGAVVVQGFIAKKEHGKIALAGPLANLLLGIVFFILGTYTIAGIHVFHYGASVNFFLALFNLLPFGPLDGKSVWKWNKMIYGITIGASLLGVFFINT